MNSIAIGQTEAPMAKPAKRRAKPRAGNGGAGYVTIAGKRVKSTPRMARIMRAIRGLKGLEVPPR